MQALGGQHLFHQRQQLQLVDGGSACGQQRGPGARWRLGCHMAGCTASSACSPSSPGHAEPPQRTASLTAMQLHHSNSPARVVTCVLLPRQLQTWGLLGQSLSFLRTLLIGLLVLLHRYLHPAQQVLHRLLGLLGACTLVPPLLLAVRVCKGKGKLGTRSGSGGQHGARMLRMMCSIRHAACQARGDTMSSQHDVWQWH